MIEEEVERRPEGEEDNEDGPFKDDEVLVCSYDGCGKEFRWKKNLQVHIRVNHVNPGAFLCEYAGCGLSFGYKHVLLRHVQKIHVEGRRHRSTMVQVKAGQTPPTNKRSLNHDNEGEEPTPKETSANGKTPTIECAFDGCGKCFKGRSNMRAHFRICHTGAQIIECPEGCGAKFSYRHVMQRHVDNIHVKGKKSRITALSKKDREERTGPRNEFRYQNHQMEGGDNASVSSEDSNNSSNVIHIPDDPQHRSSNNPVLNRNNMLAYTNSIQHQLLQQQQQQEYNAFLLKNNQSQSGAAVYQSNGANGGIFNLLPPQSINFQQSHPTMNYHSIPPNSYGVNVDSEASHGVNNNN